MERRRWYGGGFLWIWVLIVLICAFWFVGWGWGGYGGWWWGGRPVAAGYGYGYGTPYGAANGGSYNATLGNRAENISGSGLAVPNANNKASYVGQSFSLQNVPVQNVVNNKTVWVGTNNGKSMLLVLTGPANSTSTTASARDQSAAGNQSGNTNTAVQNGSANTANNSNNSILAKGDRITVNGVIEKAPSEKIARQNWDLSNQGAKRLANEQAYLQGDRIGSIQTFRR